MKRQDPSCLYNKKYYADELVKRGGEKLINFKKAIKYSGIKSGMRILDNGCGYGELLFLCARMNIMSYGVDFSQDAIKIAKKNMKKEFFNKSIKLKKINSLKLTFPSNYFDAVFFLDVIEHIPKYESKKALQEIFRVLKPNGKLILRTAPNKLYCNLTFPYFVRWVHFLLYPAIFVIFGRKITISRNPRTSIDLKMHINEQTEGTLKELFSSVQFRKIRIWHDMEVYPKPEIIVYKIIANLWPISEINPIKKYFSNALWCAAEK